MNADQAVRKLGIMIAGASFCLCVLLDLYFFPPTTLFPDEQRFLTSATNLASTGIFAVGADRAWEMPGTAFFFSGFIVLLSDATAAIVPIRLAQALLLLLQAVLIGNIALRIFEDRLAGFVAFAIVAIYPFFMFYQGLLLSETLFNTFLIMGIAGLYWWRAQGLRIGGVFFLTCLCFGLAIYTKATLTVLPPVLLASATLGARNLRLTARVLLIGSLVYAALLTPWWVRNFALLHAFVPFTTGAAENLYLGNNPRNPMVGIDSSADTDPEVVNRVRAIPNEVDRQRAFADEAIRYIVADPGAFAQRMLRKFLRFWNVVPNAAEFHSTWYRIVSAASFGPVLLLSVLSAILWWRRLIAAAPIMLVVIYFTMLHVVTIASLRYRLPLEPFLIAMASAPIAAVARRALGCRVGDGEPLPPALADGRPVPS
jgi:4-amino-4-deoxy-L-arabinose transferase-like glycosyltransferase